MVGHIVGNSSLTRVPIELGLVRVQDDLVSGYMGAVFGMGFSCLIPFLTGKGSGQ